jgi:hypothetical protein
MKGHEEVITEPRCPTHADPPRSLLFFDPRHAVKMAFQVGDSFLEILPPTRILTDLHFHICPTFRSHLALTAGAPSSPTITRL